MYSLYTSGYIYTRFFSKLLRQRSIINKYSSNDYFTNFISISLCVLISFIYFHFSYFRV